MKAWRKKGAQKDIPRSTCLKATASFKSLEPIVVEMSIRGYKEYKEKLESDSE